MLRTTRIPQILTAEIMAKLNDGSDARFKATAAMAMDKAKVEGVSRGGIVIIGELTDTKGEIQVGDIIDIIVAKDHYTDTIASIGKNGEAVNSVGPGVSVGICLQDATLDLILHALEA